jgi:hypothetical protein
MISGTGTQPSELSSDFLSHLEQRYAVSRSGALALLAQWVGEYEPARRPPIHVQPPHPRGASQRVGARRVSRRPESEPEGLCDSERANP